MFFDSILQPLPIVGNTGHPGGIAIPRKIERRAGWCVFGKAIAGKFAEKMQFLVAGADQGRSGVNVPLERTRNEGVDFAEHPGMLGFYQRKIETGIKQNIPMIVIIQFAQAADQLANGGGLIEWFAAGESDSIRSGQPVCGEKGEQFVHRDGFFPVFPSIEADATRAMDRATLHP